MCRVVKSIEKKIPSIVSTLQMNQVRSSPSSHQMKKGGKKVKGKGVWENAKGKKLNLRPTLPVTDEA